jgi:hypothetical protein
VAVLELLRTQGYRLPSHLSVHAAANGRIDVLRWMQRSGIALDKSAAVIAARGDHIDVVQYLLSDVTKFTLDESLCRAAELSGQLHTLQYLRGAGCPWSDTIADDAAQCGSIEVMQWLREHGAAIRPTTMLQAAKQGHLELAQYLCAEGCPWDDCHSSSLWA